MNYAIIAAGEGSRLVAEGVASPKPLVELDGRPMIRRLLDIMQRCGAHSVSIIVNEAMPEVADYITQVAMRELDMEILLTVKTTPDSMRSFHEATRRLPAGRFVLTTVDTIFDEERFIDYVRAFEADATADGYMAVTDYVDDEKPLWVAVDAAGGITGFHDSREAGDRYVSAGIYGLDTRSALPVLEQCMAAGVGRMRNYQRALVAAGLALRAMPIGKVIDVDHAGDIAKARRLIKKENEND